MLCWWRDELLVEAVTLLDSDEWRDSDDDRSGKSTSGSGVSYDVMGDSLAATGAAAAVDEVAEAVDGMEVGSNSVNSVAVGGGRVCACSEIGMGE